MRSPEPEFEVDALPPCFTTCRPGIPDAIMAADVETLNVFCLSPPVPTMSTEWSMESLNCRIVETAVEMKSELKSKPVVFKAVKKDDDSTSLASPLKICFNAIWNCSVVKVGGVANKA
ncbi:unnamed protein product [Ambrosiozyma monospora]|uniref:Unnamed protein product n=1 Tax=Ambrosiozyma monospora TaxID=43982 RepID=A0A9W6YZ43_AMBMO|nr:unnamed protein product [Ambrosiozyma monospora]